MPARAGDADSDLCVGSLASTDADEQQQLHDTAGYAPVHQFACFRESPRPCVNQELVNQLAPLRSYRFMKYGTDHEKFISYATAVSVIIGTPFRITTVEQARKLPKIGPKLINKIEEFLRTGKIQEAQNILASNEYKVLTALNTVHGIGSKTAVKLYEDYKVRTLEQALTHLKAPEQELFRKYHADLSEKIPRNEVESIHELSVSCFSTQSRPPILTRRKYATHGFVKLQVNKIQRRSFSLLCGGYRRGKEESNDVDILITFPHAEGVERGVLRQLVQRLCAKGLIPPDGILGLSEAGTNRDSSLVANKPASRIDALDRAMVIFRHPADPVSGRLRDMYRRVDLIVSRWGSWGSAVVGWTGSTQFERDLRRHAERQGFKFDSGGIRTRDTDRPVEAQSEEDVFRVLGLKYIPPELRNADP